MEEGAWLIICISDMMAAGDIEPSARSSCFCCTVEGKTYLWGGSNRDLLEEKTSLEEFAASVYTFDPYLETWATLTPGGSPPSGIHSGACACAGHHMYTYGGWDTSAGGRDGSLHCLDTSTLMWTKMASTGPMKKMESGMITYGKKLLLLGGKGVPSGPIQPGSEFVLNNQHTNGRGWTNELHTFNLEEGEELANIMCCPHQLV